MKRASRSSNGGCHEIRDESPCIFHRNAAHSSGCGRTARRTPESIVCRGLSAVGFSYAWGGECWCGSGCDPDLISCEPGVCTVNDGFTGCPDCTHTGTYGADCSGFVSKAWQVPDPFAVSACDVARYTASSFTQDHEYWDLVPMDSLQPADAVASDSHVILVIDYMDPYGEHEVIEAKGCIYGVVRNSRTFSSVYSGARRVNLTTCECEEGELDSEPCGDCGTRSRSCVGCMWSPWSGCDGPDPDEGTTCDPGDGSTGQCAMGVQLCVAGWLTCQGTPPPRMCVTAWTTTVTAWLITAPRKPSARGIRATPPAGQGSHVVSVAASSVSLPTERPVTPPHRARQPPAAAAVRLMGPCLPPHHHGCCWSPS